MHSPAPDARASAAPAARWAWCAPALVALAIYLPALRNAFAYDDDVIVVTNARIHQWATLLAAVRSPYWFDGGHLYRPLTTFAFGVEWILGRGSPLPFHAVNLIWHAIVTALVARLALRWWSPAAAFAAGLWFAIHPVHVEAIANVVGRSELVCAAALLALTLVALPSAAGTRSRSATALHAMDPAASAHESAERRRLLVIAVLAAVAVASKETGAVAPILAWAAAWTPAPLERFSSETPPGSANTGRPPAVHDRARFARRAVAAALLGVVAVVAARFALLSDAAGDDPHVAFRTASPGTAVLLALSSLPRAVGLVLVPQLPRNDYSPTDAQLAHPNLVLVACGIGIVACGFAAFIIHVRRPQPWSWAVLFAAATVAPVSNLIIHTGVVVAERTLYSPSVPAALAMGVAIATLWQRRARLPLAIAGAVAGAALIFTEVSIPMWHDSPSAFRSMVSRSPESYRGYALLAARERDSGHVQAAHLEYRSAIARFSRDPVLLYHAGTNALRAGDTATGLAWLTGAVGVDSTQLRARTALASLCIHRGDTARARTLLIDGLRIAPEQRSWRVMLARLRDTADRR